MKLLKFFTPFLLIFPGWLVLAAITWLGKLENYNLSPMRGSLFVAIGFTMVIIDLFIKYLIGKSKVHYVWVIEAVLLVVLCIMIIPRLSAEIYV